MARRVRGETLEEPPSRFAGGVRIITRAGAEVQEVLDHVPGSPRNPLSEAEILAKFRANAALALGEDRVAILEETLLAFDGGASLDPFSATIRAGHSTVSR